MQLKRNKRYPGTPISLFLPNKQGSVLTQEPTMAALSSFSTLHLIPRAPNSQMMPPSLFKTQGLVFSAPFKHLTFRSCYLKSHDEGAFLLGTRKLRSTEEETAIPEEEDQPQQQEQQAVSVPVSPSDTLTMFFQAEGTMNEASIPTVVKALEGMEGISDLKVQVLEGIASVELTKQTTVQATGVASGLVEIIQGSGFKLQTLNLSFEDEEDLVVV